VGAARAYRRTITVDVIWTGERGKDWGLTIAEALSRDDPCLYDIAEGKVHVLCEHVAIPEGVPDA
jgi:hypothetical protein